jgi:hypothetical protein
VTDYRSFYDREYIGSWDLPRDRDAIVIIRDVKGVELNNGRTKNKKPVLYFAGKDKGMVCNKTNAKTIAGLYGNDVAAWVGKAVALFVTTTRDPNGGGDVDCIRVRNTAPAPKGKADKIDAETGEILQ